MQQNDFTKFVVQAFEDLSKMFAEKNEQYATGDPVANFRTGARLRYGSACNAHMYEVAKDYVGKHIAHVYNNDVYGPKVEESLADIAVYSVIMLYLRSQAQNEVHCHER